MQIAIGQLSQESNTFNPLPTTRENFEQFGVVRGADVLSQMADTNELGGFIQSLRAATNENRQAVVVVVLLLDRPLRVLAKKLA